MRRLRRLLPPLLLLAGLIGVWELYVDLGGADQLILPPPHAVATALVDDRGLLWSNLRVTGGEILLGMAASTVLGLACAFAIHFSKLLRDALYPLIIGSQAVPIVLFSPLLVLWLGFSLAPKLIVVVIVSFFPIVVATLDGLGRVDPDLLKLMRTFDAPRRRTFREVELPSALPGVLTGAKIAAVYTPIAALFAEWSGATSGNSGLGTLFSQAEAQLLLPRAYAAVFVLSAFAIVLFTVLTMAERRLVPWAYQQGETTR